MKKLKWLGVLLTMIIGILLASGVNQTACAGEVPAMPRTNGGEVEIPAGAAVVDSGDCGANGDNVQWTLYDNGLAVISGTGAMHEYTTLSTNRSPFYENAQVQEAIIQEGVTTVGGYLFYNASGLTSVTIPAGVTSIGAYAFHECSALKTMTLPSSVQSIANYAFWKCSGLTGTLHLPDSLQTVGTGAFYMAAYGKVVFPSGLTAIGDSAFSYCKSLTELQFPERMAANCIIGTYAFSSCSELPSLILPEGVTALGKYAVQFCYKLKSVTLPSSLQSIGDSAFAFDSLLEEVNMAEGLLTLGRRAFQTCPKLTHLIIPASVTDVGEGIFRGTRIRKVFFLGLNTAIDTNLVDPAVGFSGTIYCLEGSPAAALAQANKYDYRYMDPVTLIDSVREIETEYGHIWLAIGTEQEACVSLDPYVQGATFTWTSDVPEIVSLRTSDTDSTVAVLTANALGTANITVTSPWSSVNTVIGVDVYTPVEDFELSATLWMYPQDSAQLNIVNVVPAGTEGTFVWASSNESVASVDQSGLVTSGSPGETVISVRNGNLVKQTAVHVNAPLDALYFDFEAMALKKGYATQLFSDLPWLNEHSVNHLVVFSSLNEAVATVDQLGWVTGRDRGIATVRVSAYNNPGVYADCTVVVLSQDPQTLVLPESLSRIEDAAFSGIGSAEILMIPDNTGLIGEDAFAGCSSLLIVRLPGEIQLAGNAFSDCGEWVFLCPNDSTAAAYAAEKGMQSFEEMLWIRDEDCVEVQ